MTDNICNRDCLHCLYDDCILPDGAALTEDEARLSKELDHVVNPRTKILTAEQKARASEYAKSYRKKHAAEIAIKRHARYIRDKEQVKAQVKKYSAEHRLEINRKRSKYRARRKAEQERRS